MNTKYTIAIVFLIITGCKKETTGFASKVQGTWELASTDGAWTGHKDYAPGNGNTISFSGNTYSQKTRSADTTYQYSATFKIYTGKPCDLANEQTLISFDNNEYASSFSLSGEMLTIGTT